MFSRVGLAFVLMAIVSTASAKVSAVATTGFIADMVRNVGGSRIEVVQIVPNGADPHSFEPKPSVLKSVQNSEVFFANGLKLEPFLRKLLTQLKKSARVVLLAEGQKNLISTGRKGEFDPHLWLDPTYGVSFVQKIEQILIELDPAGKQIYASNSKKYQAQILNEDAKVIKCLSRIPISQRNLVSQHDALEYLVRHYGLTLTGSLSDFVGQERGIKSFVALIKTIKSNNVKAIFAEPQFPVAQVTTLAEASGAKIATIYSDAFDQKVKSYLDLIRFNGLSICDAFRMN